MNKMLSLKDAEKAVKAAAKRAGAPDGNDQAPRALGFDVDELNQEFALVLLGSKAVVVQESPGAPIEERVRILAPDAFRMWFLNRRTEIKEADGRIKPVTWASAWLSSPRRRQYRGLTFHPFAPYEVVETGDHFNLWRGFTVAPRPKRNGYSTYRDHLLNNLCGGDEGLYRWVFGWFAHMVQRPRERVGTALVCRGLQGAGKTIIGETIGSLFGPHYFLVDDPRYLVGQFNAHMASCLLLQADEGFWAGDKAAEGRLKGLITAEFQMIEAKGVDPIRLKNYVHILISSNNDWVIPAGKDERRFCVLDIDPRCAQNHEYFGEMRAQLDNGGREALLADLLDFDLSTVNVRQIPRTEALLEQKLRSLDSVESWWFDRLSAGATTRSAEGWVREIPCDALFDDYIAASDRVGIRRKSEEATVGKKLHKLLPELKVSRPRLALELGRMQRVRCYQLPPLAECRAAFETGVGQSISWGDDVEDGSGPGSAWTG